MTVEHQTNAQDTSAETTEQLHPAQPSRRSFAKAGLAASGVLLTLSSKPALGCQVTSSPSGFISGNVSHRGISGGSGGYSPRYWESCGSWPSIIVKTSSKNAAATKFSKFFNVSTSRSTAYANVTCLDILSTKSFDSSGIGKYCMAAYLNAVSGLTPFLPPAKVIQIFNDWALTGYFHPISSNPSIKWDAAKIVDYLSKTQD